MEKWLVQAKKADFAGLGEMFSINPVIARIIRNRNIITEEEFREYLDGSLEDLKSPFMLKNMEKAVKIIAKAINEHKKIRVIGDYDIDGICSGYILTTGLEKMGALVDFDVPERIKDGYGLNIRLIEQAKKDKIELIITCDNGIAATNEIEYAKTLGMQVIVTDHHEIPYEINENEKKYIIPKADAVVDQKQNDCTYPFKELCGGGIAFKVICAIYEKCYEKKIYAINVKNECEKMSKEDFLSEFIVFAAIATVGDIVDLISENRIIVKNGLDVLSKIDNYGLNALIEANELENVKIRSYHISYVIGPCINAGGRLDTARKAFELFRCRNKQEARNKAEELKSINDERKEMTVEYTQKAIDIINSDENYLKQKVLVVYLEKCHESLAGIIAGRLKELYYKPVFVLTDCEDGVKGSGRSIENYSMYEELVLADSVYHKINMTDVHLLKRFGGHKMAAGISIDKNKIDEFRKILNESDGINDDILIKKIWIDVPLPFGYLSESLINELEVLEPFGKANEKPIFAEKNVKLNKIRVFGKNRNVISLNVENEAGNKMDATCFEKEEIFMDYIKNKFGCSSVDALMQGEKNDILLNILYYPEINEYRGFRNIRVVIKRYS